MSKKIDVTNDTLVCVCTRVSIRGRERVEGSNQRIQLATKGGLKHIYVRMYKAGTCGYYVHMHRVDAHSVGYGKFLILGFTGRLGRIFVTTRMQPNVEGNTVISYAHLCSP